MLSDSIDKLMYKVFVTAETTVSDLDINDFSEQGGRSFSSVANAC